MPAIFPLTQHVLGPGSANNDLRAQRGHTDLNAGISIGSQLANEQLIKLGVEHAIGNKLQADRIMACVSAAAGEACAWRIARRSIHLTASGSPQMPSTTCLPLLADGGRHRGRLLPLPRKSQTELSTVSQPAKARAADSSCPLEVGTLCMGSLALALVQAFPSISRLPRIVTPLGATRDTHIMGCTDRAFGY
jgi:hypothetical protein